MSRRLLQRGRYPKNPGVDQITNTNSQFPPPVAVSQPSQSGVNYYDAGLHSQPDPNSWNQQSYHNQMGYQQTPNNPSATEQSSYWSETQMFPSTMQAPWNESWNAKPENPANSSGYANYQQPPITQPMQQWQQTPFTSIDNQKYSQHQVENYSQPQGYVFQSINNTVNYPPSNSTICYQPTNSAVDYQLTNNTADYQPTNNIADYQPANNIADYQPTNNTADNNLKSSSVNFSSANKIENYQSINNATVNNNSSLVQSKAPSTNWENGTAGVSQTEELSWTYGTPQYDNPSHSSFVQNSITNVAWQPAVTSHSFNSDPNVQTVLPPNYLPIDSGNSESVCGTQEFNDSLQQSKQSELESVDPEQNADDSANQEEVTITDYASSTLSAFFHSSDLVKPDKESSNQSKETPPAVVQSLELSSQFVRNSPDTVGGSNSGTSIVPSEVGSSEGTHSDFVQEESLDDLDINEKSFSHPVSCLVEEPVNQEVPEPHGNNSLNLPIQINKDSDESSEEPLNQQVPTKSGQSSRSTSAEREKLVIRPREDSPFKPPRLNNTKSIVVQQEVTEINPSESKPLEEKTIAHEVNLETFPDNLERPSDYEELRKQSPLYASHKYLRQDLNSSPSSLLCDNPDIPCVTLAPAAPPISSAKSDKSESSTDSRSDRLSLQSSNLSLYKLQEIPIKDQPAKIEAYEKKKRQSSSKNDMQTNCEKPSIKSSISHTNNHVSQKTIENDMYNVESCDSQSSLLLKDSKISGNSSDNKRLNESFQKPVLTEYGDSAPITSSPRREEIPQSRHADRRYSRSDNRQKFAEQKYYSYDERQYYSDREYSRPSSRNSLKDRQEDYAYQSRNEDYSFNAGRQDPRQNQEYHRPSSRMSESEISRGEKSGQYGGYYRQQYPYPPNQYPRDSRDPAYYQRHPNQKGYDYDPYQRDLYYASYYDAYQRYAYNNFNYGFYDEMYRNDPRYRQYRETQEQYRQYYAKQGYEDFERSSIHSGRSSANEISKELSTSHFQEHDIDSNESEFSAFNVQPNYSYTDGQNEMSAEGDLTSTPSSRLTPVKFAYPHPIVRFCPGGILLTAVPSHMSTVTVMPIRIQNLQELREGEESFDELKNHQGPLIRGLTHKNDVVEFCSQKVKNIKAKEDVVDRDSYILLWELMILLLRQNGSVAGSDIAELLLKDHEVLRPTSVPLKHAIDTPLVEQQSPADVMDSSSQSHAGDTSSPDEGIVVLHDKTILNNSRSVDVDKITRKFREFLLYGHKKDALDWAMKHGLWGHALFLASKMDLRTYANVMTRFANSLALNDPLQTLYQLMSGRQPLAVTNVADKKWGDWRPHLAMILSNPSSHPEVDSRSITTLGDTLASKGCLCAAHFCYIMAQVEFGTFEEKNSKLVLLSTDHMLPFEEFSSNEAIQCTEIYEYAQSLANPSFMLPNLQFYKFLYAMRLVEHGFLEEALHYCEIIASKVIEHPHLFQYDFISEVYKLATQLKYHDPHFLRGQGEYEDQEDPDWLKNLAVFVQNFNNVVAQNDDYSTTYTEQPQEVTQNFSSDSQQKVMSPIENTYSQNSMMPNIQNEANAAPVEISYYQTNHWNQPNNVNSNFGSNIGATDTSNYYGQNDLVNRQSSFGRENSLPSHEENDTTDVPSSPVTQTPPFDYYSGGNQQESKPLYDTSLYNTGSLSRERRDSVLSSGSRYSSSSMTATANKNAAKDGQKTEIKKDKPSTQAGKTWLGGIFSRLLPKGPNQMILPDDKNPTIVWDDVKNCWVNKDSNEEDDNNAPLAPPTDSELMGPKSVGNVYSSPSNNSVPPLTPMTSNNSVPPSSASQPINKFQRPKTRGMRQNYVDILSTSGATKKTKVLPEGLFTPSYDQTASPNMFIPQPTLAPSDNSSNVESSQPTYNSPMLEVEEQQVDNQAPPLMFNPAEFDARKPSVSNQRQTIGRLGRRTYPT